MSAGKGGLEGVVAATSGLCYIDGQKGYLAYRGIDIFELAEHSSFEESGYLLTFGELPTQEELDRTAVKPRPCCAEETKKAA